MAGVQTVRLAPAFMGEQATYGPSYHGGLAPPPEWWLQFVHVFAPCQLAQLQQTYHNTWAQPCHWQTRQSTYPVNPILYYFTPTAFTHQPPFYPACTSLPLHTNQPFPQPPVSYAQPSPIQRPVATPTRLSTLTPAKPSWADMSEEAPPSQMDELPTLLPKPNMGNGKGKGKSKSNKKPKASGKGNHHGNGFNHSWSYGYYDWYWFPVADSVRRPTDPLFVDARGGFESDEKPSQGLERTLFFFYDDIRHRWQVAPEVGAKGLSVLARSPVGWDEVFSPNGPEAALTREVGPPRPSGCWQIRLNEPALAIHSRRSKQMTEIPQEASQLFQDCEALSVLALEDRAPARTVSFQYEGPGEELQVLAEHPLAGDFRLLRQRYGKRPVYRRSALQPCGPGPGLPVQPGLFLFFEPRLGYWVVSTISPLASNHAVAFARPDLPGRFGQVLARTGPDWTPVLPQDARDWDAADSQGPGSHYRLGPARAPPSTLLSEQLMPTPWLHLVALGTDTPAKMVCLSGFGDRLHTLNGSYELLPESAWASRAAWARVPSTAEDVEYPKYIFFWPETGHWIIGPDLHTAQTGLARNGPGRWAAQSPDHCPGRWAALNGHSFAEDPKIFCRRQKASGGVETFGLSCPSSPRQSLGPRAKALPLSPRSTHRSILSPASEANSPSPSRNLPSGPPKSARRPDGTISTPTRKAGMEENKEGTSPQVMQQKEVRMELSKEGSLGTARTQSFKPPIRPTSPRSRRGASPSRAASPARAERGIVWRP
ncbi:unnamed protein product [Symbiodinium sp. CCMP2456]|nr:unnamed protein product [Symbiodinium sp. CCMP2456]